MNYGVDVHQLIWFESCKYNFYFWNQFRISVYSNLQKSLPWKLKSPPNLVNHKIAPITHKIAHKGAISPTLNTTNLSEGKRKHQTVFLTIFLRRSNYFFMLLHTLGPCGRPGARGHHVGDPCSSAIGREVMAQIASSFQRVCGHSRIITPSLSCLCSTWQ